ncbi:MAG: stalk domain-containing protein [Sedimentibacter sp.]|uniref:stalk domain-containing protein n=1 Tax=Sedimentibacter sp. TaxID=1960295 RepID=UPI003158A380
MKRTILKSAVGAVLILLASYTGQAYGITYEAGNVQDLENVLFEQMSKYNQDIDIKYTGTLENIEEILQNAVNKDIYVNSNIQSAKWTVTKYARSSSISLEVHYIITESKRLEADREIEEILSAIIKPDMNDHEKVKAVHDYIVKSGRYDESLQYYSDYDLLFEGTSVCNGYALLTYNMLESLGIPVKLVSGTVNGSQAHIWNMVKLGDYWFHLDATWDDPLPDTGGISYSYYMLTDNEISRDHLIEDGQSIPASKMRYYDYLKELGYKRLMMETGLDIYDEENTAADANALKTILERKIQYRPLKISVRISKSLTQESVNAAMSDLFKHDFVSEIAYGQLNSDATCQCNVLNLYLKYKDTPDSIDFDFSNKVYNTATKVNFSVYAMYGSRKVNITDKVLLYPYDEDGLKVSGSTLTFKQAGSYELMFEFQGIQKTANITALSSNAFEYITDKRADNAVNVKIYNQYIDFSSINQWPFIENGRTMVPLRAVFEVLDCSVEWDQETGTAVVKNDSTKILIPANSSTAYVNGIAKSLDAPAKMVNDRIMVPLRFISEAIHKTVIWDNDARTVLIY